MRWLLQFRGACSVTKERGEDGDTFYGGGEAVTVAVKVVAP